MYYVYHKIVNCMLIIFVLHYHFDLFVYRVVIGSINIDNKEIVSIMDTRYTILSKEESRT